MISWEENVRKSRETCWMNPNLADYEAVKGGLTLSEEDVTDASKRLSRFAPLIMRLFPETTITGGIIESPLKEIEATKDSITRENGGKEIPGRLFLKCDSHLAIAGSVKARGGIYEVLKHTEALAMEAGLLTEEDVRKGNPDAYAALADARDFFGGYKVQVGSTGNLGMSIGIMSEAIGYQAIVHMSEDAKEWKKKLLRSRGVIVKEYADDYGKAVEEGRRLSDMDEKSYFVDDEHSKDLFLGYAVAGERLKKQLDGQGITIDEKHPLVVYIPCGVGGAPGGITFGLKNIWGDHVHCFFVEPTQACCMLVGMASGLKDRVSVADYGLSGSTDADGLAVGRCSALVAGIMEQVLSGIVTVEDAVLYQYMRKLYEADQIIIEPSSCAAFAGYSGFVKFPEMGKYLEMLEKKAGDKVEPVHIVWATGGSLMPEEIVREYLGVQ